MRGVYLDGWVIVIDEDKKEAASISALLNSFSINVEYFDDPKRYIASEHFNKTHVALIDLDLATLNSFDLIQLAVERSAASAVFAMSNRGTIPLAVRAIKLGASDFLEKPIPISPIVGAVRNSRLVHSSPPKLAERFSKSLTPREMEVLEALMDGQSSKTIGRTLGISHRTIEVHRRHIFKKLKVGTIAELILMAQR
jgi:FixJ family two-component response regulator